MKSLLLVRQKALGNVVCLFPLILTKITRLKCERVQFNTFELSAEESYHNAFSKKKKKNLYSIEGVPSPILRTQNPTTAQIHSLPPKFPLTVDSTYVANPTS